MTMARRRYPALPTVRQAGVVLLAGLLALSVAGAQDRPERFPDVALIDESNPQFAALSLDVWGNTTAYVLFDGNVEEGYQRAYVWVPGDERYGTPVALALGEGNRFPSLRHRTEDDEGQLSELNWSLRWGYHHSGGTHFNYMTGESVTREGARYVRFAYSLDYMRDQPSKPDSRLMLTLGGHLPTTADWTAVPNGRRPWNAIRTSIHVNRQIEEDQIILHLSARLMHHNARVAVETMPDPFFTVNLSVAPYMKMPLYDEVLRFQDLFHTGVNVVLEPRWYTIEWNYELHPWLGGNARRDSHFMPVSRVE